MQLTQTQLEELIQFELAKSGEYFVSKMDSLIEKWNLLGKPNSPYTKVQIVISDAPDEDHPVKFVKTYSLASVKTEFLIDLISRASNLSKQIRNAFVWGIKFNILFFNPDGSRNGGIVDNHINPSAWQNEFLRSKGLPL